MSRSLNLHSSGSESDWSKINPSKQNYWQKIAMTTNGWLTPGNLLTISGACLAFFGLIQLVSDVTLSAVLLVLIGRLADMADGYVADKTGTKSPLGETLDATVDKLIALVALICLFVGNLARGSRSTFFSVM